MSVPDDWSDQCLLADFERLVDDVRRWQETAPAWPVFDRARALWARISPRLEQLRPDLDRVLVVGVLGGTGTGKSTLLNALVENRVCEAGDARRPTTRQPVILTHRDFERPLPELDGCHPEVRRLAVPLLKQMILIDCPDPDTQSRDAAGQPASDPSALTRANDYAPADDENHNLEVLRRILPQCDVLVFVGTTQKYKTQAVTEELLRHTSGRGIVFVQTHAAVDADITADWQRHMSSQGFPSPQMFRLDSEEALLSIDEQRPLPPGFAKLVDFLRAEFSQRGKRRILRANALDWLDSFLDQVQRDWDAGSPGLKSLNDAVDAEKARLMGGVRRQLDRKLQSYQGMWRARLLGEVALRWSWGPFAAFLRLLGAAQTWLYFIPAMRARGLAPMLVAGTLGAGKMVADRIRQARTEGSWLAATEIGFSPGDLAQSRSVLAGFASEAGIDPARAAESLRAESSEEEVGATAQQQLYQQIEAGIARAIEQRAAGRSGKVFHLLMEILFCTLPLLLLARLAKNFFYDQFWLGSSQPLLGFDYVLQSALWMLLWGLLLRGLLAWRLLRGLNRDLSNLIGQLTPDAALKPLFDEFAAPVAAIQQHVDKIAPWRRELDRLRRDLEWDGSSQLGRRRRVTSDV